MPDYSINLTIQNVWTITRFFLDVLILWFIIYYAIKVVRNNARTIQIFKGVFLVLIVNALSKIFGLGTITYISDLFISWGLLAIIIIFQPEIRGLLERIGKTNTFTRMTTLLANEREKLVDEVYRAVLVLSQERVGALISIEQSQSLQDYIKTGIVINSAVSKELLSSIFMTTTPLHDGAVIIQGDKIACASAYFPPTAQDLPSRYGARHRAALGISEVSDALTIVVSEETSAISIAEKGSIFTVDDKQLRDYLRRVILNDEIEIRSTSKKRTSLFDSSEPELLIKKEKERSTHSFLDRLFKSEEKKTQEDVKDQMKVPFNNRYKYEHEHEINSDDEVIEIVDKGEEKGASDGQKG